MGHLAAVVDTVRWDSSSRPLFDVFLACIKRRVLTTRPLSLAQTSSTRSWYTASIYHDLALNLERGDFSLEM